MSELHPLWQTLLTEAGYDRNQLDPPLLGAIPLGCALFEYGLGEPERMRTLYGAYVDAGGPGRLIDRGDLTMLVAQLGHIARIGCERWLTSATDQERADNAGWVTEFLDGPVTLDVVDRILVAVNS